MALDPSTGNQPFVASAVIVTAAFAGNDSSKNAPTKAITGTTTLAPIDGDKRSLVLPSIKLLTGPDTLASMEQEYSSVSRESARYFASSVLGGMPVLRSVHLFIN